MSPHQRAAYESLRHRYCVTGPFENDFPAGETTGRRLVVEIGFGMGDSLAEMANAMVDTDFLGVEVHRPGVGKLLGRLEAEQIPNVRVFEGDATELLSVYLPEGRVDAFHIYFPDPWPKKRHHKRRLIRPGFPELVHPLLKPGGYVHLVTDWENYAETMREIFDACALFENRFDGWAPRPPWRRETAFERKGRAAGRSIYELMYHVRAT